MGYEIEDEDDCRLCDSGLQDALDMEDRYVTRLIVPDPELEDDIIEQETGPEPDSYYYTPPNRKPRKRKSTVKKLARHLF